MTSSPDRARVAVVNKLDDLPPALSSMWRLCKLGYRHEPRLMLAAFVLSQLAALPDALLALWLMLLGEGVLENRPGLVRAAATPHAHIPEPVPAHRAGPPNRTDPRPSTPPQAPARTRNRHNRATPP